jgi:hypothetical protein
MAFHLDRPASASARSASRMAFRAASRAPWAGILALVIRPPWMVSRDFVLYMAQDYGAFLGALQILSEFEGAHFVSAPMSAADPAIRDKPPKTILPFSHFR